MRYQGRITTWKDDQGYGFVTPNGGGAPVFVHIRSFSARRRPAGNELVTYELTSDAGGRPSGENVAFVGQRVAPVTPLGPGVAPIAFAAFFLLAAAAAVAARRLPGEILAYYVAASAVAALVYAWDKSSAMNDRWRTKESTLHLLGLLGGWPGAVVAQKVLRHKWKKASFQTAFWTTVFLNCMAYAWLFSSSGSQALRCVVGAG